MNSGLAEGEPPLAEVEIGRYYGDAGPKIREQISLKNYEDAVQVMRKPIERRSQDPGAGIVEW